MKNPETNLRARNSSRLMFIVIFAALFALSFSATALMKSSRNQQAKVKGKAAQSKDNSKADPSAEFWQEVFDTPSQPDASEAGQQVVVQAKRFRSFTLNRSAMERKLAAAPKEFTAAARQAAFILALPDPVGGFQRFSVAESPVMEPGLAVKHPEIRTYSGRGIDDQGATIRFDLTPLGFHAAIRGQSGHWYIDPYRHLDQSLYVSYFGRDLKNPHGPFVEHEGNEPSISADHSFYYPKQGVKVRGVGFAGRTIVTLKISDSEARMPSRTLSVKTDEDGSFDLEFVSSSQASPATLKIEAIEGDNQAETSYEVVTKLRDAPLLATGTDLRTYRLALITDPGYATFFGGSANVTAAKVTLMNRVSQVYEDDLSIRLQLIANNDLLNLDTYALAIAPNGPCGAIARA